MRKSCELEVSKPEVDNSGYDLILESERIIRHVQFKSSHLGSKTARQKIHLNLAAKPSGCVVWIFFDSETMELGPFKFFGGPPGEPMPAIEHFKIARHTKANQFGHKANRERHRIVPIGEFQHLMTVDELYDALFGCQQEFD